MTYKNQRNTYAICKEDGEILEYFRLKLTAILKKQQLENYLKVKLFIKRIKKEGEI